MEQSLRTVHPATSKGVAHYVSSRRHHTISNLIWGKPGLDGQAEGVYDACGPPPITVAVENTPNLPPLPQVHGQLNGGGFVTSGPYRDLE
jgi:hypothetical protein